MSGRISGLYAVTPELADTGALAAKVEAALRGGARLVQYRGKSAAPEARLLQGRLLASLCREYDALFIVNDSVELARQLAADGVHLGKDDADVDRARAALGPRRVIGVSCYNELARGRRAVQEGADYAAFGSFFASRTKPDAVRAKPELLRQAARELALPIVAIGGIEVGNAGELIDAGANALAVVSALFDADDVEQRARSFAELFTSRVQS